MLAFIGLCISNAWYLEISNASQCKLLDPERGGSSTTTPNLPSRCTYVRHESSIETARLSRIVRIRSPRRRAFLRSLQLEKHVHKEPGLSLFSLSLSLSNVNRDDRRELERQPAAYNMDPSSAQTFARAYSI